MHGAGANTTQLVVSPVSLRNMKEEEVICTHQQTREQQALCVNVLTEAITGLLTLNLHNLPLHKYFSQTIH